MKKILTIIFAVLILCLNSPRVLAQTVVFNWNFYMINM